ncbi:hypothetical protein IE53DRAFT_404174 [Violaceomyces palustris]|uniref:Uncharacterized protein n=1 Tax=Violaceomyces palustris TaxID=1673888 RepID=A0ACD0P8J3_9BASI|nr:hypothetical protein IE53DRAFT_404174 [Violaceomyces palustris]
MTRILVTGGHSGIGLSALRHIIAASHPSLPPPYHIILLSRDPQSSIVAQARQDLVQTSQRFNSPEHASNLFLDVRQMDLSSLASVRRLATELVTQFETEGVRLDLLLLNAAVAKANRNLVKDEDHQDWKKDHDVLSDDQGWYEETACVNHVAHLVLLHLLSPIISKAPSQASDGEQATRTFDTRIVFTSSALHSKLKNLDALDSYFSRSSFQSSDPWSLLDTYAASKFLQMVGIRSYRRRLEVHLGRSSSVEVIEQTVPRIEVVAVQPGFVPQTGLSRESSLLKRLVMTYLLPLMPFATSLDDAGDCVAQACYRPLQDFPTTTTTNASTGKPGADPSRNQDGYNDDGWADDVESGVKSRLLAKKEGVLVSLSPDPRAGDLRLQEKWWPSQLSDG